MRKTGLQPCPKCRKHFDTLGDSCASGGDSENCFYARKIAQNNWADGESGSRELERFQNEFDGYVDEEEADLT